jgi:hypothetical protein
MGKVSPLRRSERVEAGGYLLAENPRIGDGSFMHGAGVAAGDSFDLLGRNGCLCRGKLRGLICVRRLIEIARKV